MVRIVAMNCQGRIIATVRVFTNKYLAINVLLHLRSLNDAKQITYSEMKNG